jgi:amino-acid N-acetyltransferase
MQSTGHAAPAGALEIRPAKARDFEEVRALLGLAGLPTADVADDAGAYFLAVRAAELLGCVGLERHGNFGLLRSLAVTPDARGQGVGAALIRTVLEAARSQEVRALYLLTTTAAEYFPRVGFQEIDRTQVPASVRASSEFASLCPSTATVMRIDL